MSGLTDSEQEGLPMYKKYKNTVRLAYDVGQLYEEWKDAVLKANLLPPRTTSPLPYSDIKEVKQLLEAGANNSASLLGVPMISTEATSAIVEAIAETSYTLQSAAAALSTGCAFDDFDTARELYSVYEDAYELEEEMETTYRHLKGKKGTSVWEETQAALDQTGTTEWNTNATALRNRFERAIRFCPV